MKVVIVFVLLLPIKIISQNIPNGSFESWHVPGNYENPVSWDTPNDITSAISVYPVLKESNMVKQGLYSAHLQTRQVFASVVPGLVCLGDFSVNILTSEITLGAGPAFTYKPSHFRGWYIYDPKSGDECYIAAFLLKQNGAQYDTLARAEFQSTSQNLSWQEFNIPFQYSSAETPTHMNVIGLSSYFFTSPQVNSALYLDDLKFEYNSAVETSQTDNIKFNSFNGTVSLSDEFKGNGEIILFDIMGKTILRCKFVEKETRLPDYVGLKNGIYLLKINSDEKSTTVKFIKK